MKKTKSKPARRHDPTQLRKQFQEPEKLPFIEHIYELRKRLFYIAVSIGVFGGLAVSIQKQLTSALLKPAAGQQFIYTSPGGGFDFAFRLCMYTGIAMSIPVIVYQILRYLEPLVKKQTMRFMAWFSIWSGVLACVGISFGYFIGLPAGLHFLLQGFSTTQIKALISIQSYLAFVMVYLLGSALLFQIPLVLLFINRIRRLKPKKLLKMQRWVILIAFILGAVISPSPDIRNQTILSGPIIVMYDASIIAIWFINRRHHKPKKVLDLLARDAEVRAERLAKFSQAQASLLQTKITLEPSVPAINRPMSASEQTTMSTRATPAPNRPRKYVQEFSRPARRPIIRQIQQTE